MEHPLGEAYTINGILQLLHRRIYLRCLSIFKKHMSDISARWPKASKDPRRRLHGDQLGQRLRPLFVGRKVMDIDVFHHKVRARAMIWEPGTVEFRDADGRLRICVDARVKEQVSMGFGHFSIVILDEEDLPIRSSVRETIIVETFLAAQFNDLVFRGQIWDRGVKYFLISDNHVECPGIIIGAYVRKQRSLDSLSHRGRRAKTTNVTHKQVKNGWILLRSDSQSEAEEKAI